nr:ABC transporter ATP-binding protein [Arsenicicoccus piscis]
MGLFQRRSQGRHARGNTPVDPVVPPRPVNPRERAGDAQAVDAKAVATPATQPAQPAQPARPPRQPRPIGPAAAATRDLTKIYGQGDAEVRALDGVSIDFEQGRFTAVMGPSGSGKSTLMHCAAGLDAPTAGEVRIGDVEIGALKDKDLTELRRDRVGFIFQAFNLIPTLTAHENITLPVAIAGRQPDQEWYDTVIDTVGLRDRLEHKPSELSGGQQQRVACARALVSKPQIIFADEPTGNLDSTSGAEVLGFLRRSVDEFEQTIVMVTHDAVAASYTDRVVFLADGQIVDELLEPTREEVLRTMAHLDETVRARRVGATATGV